MSQFRRIITTALAENQNALDLRCSDTDGLKAELSDFNEVSSRACYVWQKGRGLYRIDMPYFTVPNTASFERALAHIQRSAHFGIYLFEGVSDEFKVVSTWATFRKLVADRGPQRKMLLFAGKGLNTPDHMSDLFTHYDLKIETGTAAVSRTLCA